MGECESQPTIGVRLGRHERLREEAEILRHLMEEAMRAHEEILKTNEELQQAMRRQMSS